MITCQHARQLFDRHLDDELSPSLQAELHAHVLQCTPCQNHLALLEACGDVIRLDTSEPKLSGSFTDRVLAASRQQAVAVPASRSAGGRRIFWRIGAPMAAAAGIVLAMILVSLAPKQDASLKTVVASDTISAPKEIQKNLINLTGRIIDQQSADELAQTPEMKALPFLDAVLNPLVKGTQNAVAGGRQSYEDIETLVRVLFAGTNERLVAEYREKHPDVPQQAAEQVISDLDILPSFIEPVTELPAVEAVPSNEASPDAL